MNFDLLSFGIRLYDKQVSKRAKFFISSIFGTRSVKKQHRFIEFCRIFSHDMDLSATKKYFINENFNVLFVFKDSNTTFDTYYLQYFEFPCLISYFPLVNSFYSSLM